MYRLGIGMGEGGVPRKIWERRKTEKNKEKKQKENEQNHPTNVSHQLGLVTSLNPQLFVPVLLVTKFQASGTTGLLQGTRRWKWLGALDYGPDWRCVWWRQINVGIQGAFAWAPLLYCTLSHMDPPLLQGLCVFNDLKPEREIPLSCSNSSLVSSAQN